MDIYYVIYESIPALGEGYGNSFELLLWLAVMYMVAMYNVGTKLTTLQIALLNTVYLLVYGLVFISYVTTRALMTETVLEVYAAFERQGMAFEYISPIPDIYTVGLSNAISLTAGAAILLISLAFSWSIRHGHRRIAAPHLQSDNGEEEGQ